jgi:plastocyanin
MSSDDSHSQDKEPIILTTPRRFAKGLIIVVAMMAIGAAILLPFFADMAKNPPPVTQIRTERPPAQQQQQQAPAAGAGTTTITILQGAAVQGSPDYDPDNPQVPLSNKIVWDNQDTVPHTATSGTGPSDPNAAKVFDTSIINAGESSNPVELKDVKEGDTISYHCTIHPYMTAQLSIAAAAQGGGGAQTGANQTGAAQTGATGGPTINILQGAAVQGSPDYDPDVLTAKKGDEVTVVNQDTVPHTVTSGTGPSDPNSAQLFDTSIINGGESAKLSLAQVNPGQYDYHCTIHPYMTGKLTVE